MAIDLKQIVHEQSVRSDFPPQLFGVSWGIARLGSYALPSETITCGSFAAAIFLFGALSVTEATRFFFRLTFTPVWFSCPAFAIALFIAWRGSMRPGPRLPRVWALLLTVVNAALLLSGVYALNGKATLPEYLRNPYPLHAMALSAAVGTVMLLPRLYPMHPLKALVQTIAPLALTAVLIVTIPACVQFLKTQMESERQTLTSMADNLSAAALRLRAAARFPYSDPELLRAFALNRERVEAALAGIKDPPEKLSLPDPTRWEAARILEEDGFMPPGQLEKAARDLIDAVHAVIVSNLVPELRTGRYLPDGSALDQYILNDDWAKRRRERPPMFGPAGEIGVGYYSNAGKWLAHINALSSGKTKGYYQARMAAVDGRREELSKRASTYWWADLLTLRHGSQPRPPLNLSEVFETPLGTDAKAMAEVSYWAGLTWAGAFRLAKAGICRQQRWGIENLRDIPAPDDSLSEAQRASGRIYRLGVRYDAYATIQCYGYHAPINESPTPLVIELRLDYVAKDLESRGDGPCEAACWRNPQLPGNTTVTRLDLYVDAPVSPNDEPGYASGVWQAFSRSIGHVDGGAIRPAAGPRVIPQSQDQKVVWVRIRPGD